VRSRFRPRKTIFFQVGAACLVCGLMVLLVRCIGPAPGSGGCRTVHVRVVVDPETASREHWQKTIGDLFEKADRVLQSWAKVALQVDTMEVRDIETTASHDSLPLGDCLIKEQAAGSSDIVVYFGKTGIPPTLIAGMPLYELGYAFIQMPAENNKKSVDQKTYYSLIHWLGHMLGAVHCYYNKENVTVMNPFIHDGAINESGREDKPSQPIFHEGNAKIMTVLSRRPFEEGQWDSSRWQPIKRVYEQVRDRYNPWKIDETGGLTGYESDAFHEGNLLLYQSSWASLCGMHAEALSCLDSLEVLYKAIQKTCIKEGVVGKTRLCTICGYASGDITNWFELQKFYIGLRRAIVLLRAGSQSRADACFSAAMDSLPQQLASVKDKFDACYRFYKERYASRANSNNNSK
jgi:hypothetical protein